MLLKNKISYLNHLWIDVFTVISFVPGRYLGPKKICWGKEIPNDAY